MILMSCRYNLCRHDPMLHYVSVRISDHDGLTTACCSVLHFWLSSADTKLNSQKNNLVWP